MTSPTNTPTAAGSDPTVNREEVLAALPPRRDLLGRIVRHQGVQAVAMTVTGGLVFLAWLMLPIGWRAVTAYGAIVILILLGMWFSRPTRVR